MKGGAVKKIKVALVDDHAVVRMGLRYALSLFKDIELVGELEDGEGASSWANLRTVRARRRW